VLERIVEGEGEGLFLLEELGPWKATGRRPPDTTCATADGRTLTFTVDRELPGTTELMSYIR